MPPEGLRRSGRIQREIAILLVGSDMEGKVFSEQTKTVVLSRHGAGIVSQHKLSAEQEMIIRRLDTDGEADVRVIGQIGAHEDSYTYGVAFLSEKINFWGIEFPPATESEKQASHLLVECSSCKGREAVDHNELEADVYAINEGIVRYCKRCGSSTVWKRASGVAEPEAVSASPASKPEPPLALSPAPEPATLSAPKSAAPQANRRKHVRAKVNFAACIRIPGSDDDIVECEDISRGGLRFKSRRRYREKTLIKVAAPFSPGSPAIFVSAQIVRSEEIEGQKLFRYGAAYVK